MAYRLIKERAENKGYITDDEAVALVRGAGIDIPNNEFVYNMLRNMEKNREITRQPIGKSGTLNRHIDT